MMFCIVFCFFFKQKTAYEMRISDWSSDVCSSDLFSHLGKTRLLHGRRDELRDPLTAPHFERLATQIGQDHLHLAAIIGVDRARRSEERRVGKECVSSVDLGGRRIIKKKK